MVSVRANSLLTLGLALLLGACKGSYSGNESSSGGSGNGGGTGGGNFTSDKSFFAARVQPALDFCRTCHIPGGVGDTDKGKRFMLSSNTAEDYDRLKASWETLGKGVETNRILLKPSGQDPEPHSGGTPWPKNGAAYGNMKILLSCWEDPSGCLALISGGGGGTPGTELPLLGNPGKHYFVSQLCEGAPDSKAIDWSLDPRRMLTQEAGLIDSEQYAVHFNDPYEICHTDTLFETQARQNEQRAAQGKKPIYSAKRDPANCGEWRAAVKAGHDWIAMTPTDQPYSGSHSDPQGLIAAGVELNTVSPDAKAWNSLWKVWGIGSRPENFDEHVFERYGHTPPPDHIYNPYPIIDPARGIDETGMLSETFGGSGRLPLGWAQGRDASGKYQGTLGLTCFSCHAGQIGTGEVMGRDGRGNAKSYGGNATGSFMGLPNTNHELGVLFADLLHAQTADTLGFGNPSPVPAFGYNPLINTTRGTNAADTEIEGIVLVRDYDTLEFSHVFSYPLHASMGDQDPPAWWWLAHKTRYLWFGGHSTDSSRGNMYFGSVNELSGEQVKENERTFEDVHQWSLSVEPPSFPGELDAALAEQGAILFHEKNLWADEANADIPRPKGNGSCAGCHGAYAPRYINDTRFLPSPKLAGTVGYTVPIEIVDTDPAQAEGWAQEIREHVSTFWWSYPDAVEGYRLPEEKDPLSELLDDLAIMGASGSDYADHLARNANRTGAFQPIGDAVAMAAQASLGSLPGTLPLAEQMGRVKGACGFEEKTVGYVTPPLHGVWASAPYFHNGSVPSVWAVLKPEDRPKVWRRQRSDTPVHFNAFDARLAAYDFEKLGWKYERLVCGDGGQGVPYYTCQGPIDRPVELNWFLDTVLGGVLWPMWMAPQPIGDQGLADRMVFNTDMYSKKNRGHEWTRVLTDQERLALLEYLKTL